jgi:hypothetical protein
MRDQADLRRVYTLVVFESEEKARAREQDPRRQERPQAARETVAAILAGPPELTDLTVVEEWTDAGRRSTRTRSSTPRPTRRYEHGSHHEHRDSRR